MNKITDSEGQQLNGDQPVRQADEQLRNFASVGDLGGVNACLEQGANLNTCDQFGISAMGWAARNGHLEVVKRLVEAGADIEGNRVSEFTPLYNSAMAGELDVVKFLVGKGARVTSALLSSVQQKVSILKENAENGMVRPEAVQAWLQFLKYFQVVQIRQVEPQTEFNPPEEARLLQAAYQGDLAGMETALGTGANVNASDAQDISALRWAVNSGKPEAVSLLLNAGANINQQSGTGWTALMQAVMVGSLGMASLLVDRGADLNVKTFVGASAQYFAHDMVKFSSDEQAAREIIQLLESHGAELSWPKED